MHGDLTFYTYNLIGDHVRRCQWMPGAPAIISRTLVNLFSKYSYLGEAGESCVGYIYAPVYKQNFLRCKEELVEAGHRRPHVFIAYLYIFNASD